MPVWEQLATDQFDPWQVFPRQVFTPYFCLLLSNACVVVSQADCLGVTGVKPTIFEHYTIHELSDSICIADLSQSDFSLLKADFPTTWHTGQRSEVEPYT